MSTLWNCSDYVQSPTTTHIQTFLNICEMIQKWTDGCLNKQLQIYEGIQTKTQNVNITDLLVGESNGIFILFGYIPANASLVCTDTGNAWKAGIGWQGLSFVPVYENQNQIEVVTLKVHSYTPRTLSTCCSQSEFRKLKIRESRARALSLYNCTPNISPSADASVSVA